MTIIHNNEEFKIKDWDITIETPFNLSGDKISGPFNSLLKLYHKKDQREITISDPSADLLIDIINNTSDLELYKEAFLGFKNLPNDLRLYIEMLSNE